MIRIIESSEEEGVGTFHQNCIGCAQSTRCTFVQEISARRFRVWESLRNTHAIMNDVGGVVDVPALGQLDQRNVANLNHDR